ncbi:MAG: heavy metal translocating P-type ATPase [Limisphaera sp.]|nr:heavy metal translocating P-type ATPase [Limisphaera sp.]
MGWIGDRVGVALRKSSLPTEPDTPAPSDQGRDGGTSVCRHCGTPCGAAAVRNGAHVFCCHGCKTVFDLLQQHGLGRFYDLSPTPGLRVTQPADPRLFAHLDDPAVQDRLVEFSDGRFHRVTLSIPTIHCVACVWLLENLFQLREGIGRSEVNFGRRELHVTYDAQRLRLSELVALLASLGYEPVFRLGDTAQRSSPAQSVRLWLQLGVAGFAFGNVMMLSFPSYLGLEPRDSPGIRWFLGLVSLGLSLPVLLYSAADYWRAAWQALRHRTVTLDLPIAAGLLALFGQSLWEIGTQTGEGYLDSLTGLVFFLLCGRWFQNKSYERLSFDADYQAFFPLSVTRCTEQGEEVVPVARLRVGDRLRLRHGELLPADARLVEGRAEMDYSFVTGESEPVRRRPGDLLYAGGQQIGGSIVVEVVKPVSQSYLSSLWARLARPAEEHRSFQTLTNRLSRWFVAGVALVALGSAWAWGVTSGPSMALKTFTAVLIVACPCALALSAPFALGTVQRWLARNQIFLKNSQVLERLARVTTIVFDKTGTLTTAGTDRLRWVGPALSPSEQTAVRVLAEQSTHPLARQLANSLHALADEARGSTAAGWPGSPGAGLEWFREHPGRGMEGRVQGREVWLGSAYWLRARGVSIPEACMRTAHAVHVAIDGVYRGSFQLQRALRRGAEALTRRLAGRFELALLSGDQPRERALFQRLLGPGAWMAFRQSPEDKQEFVRRLQQGGRVVMMVGDGLNDAGALRQSDVGVAVVEDIGAFSPASDVILEARRVAELPELLALARNAVRVVYVCFGLSLLYNAVGLTLAVQGRLSPLVAAILMPLSSVTVVSTACALGLWVGKRSGLASAHGPEGWKP